MNHEVTVELKNDISVRGTLKSVDQYLNIKLDDISVVEEMKYPHLVREERTRRTHITTTRWDLSGAGVHGVPETHILGWDTRPQEERVLIASSATTELGQECLYSRQRSALCAPACKRCGHAAAGRCYEERYEAISRMSRGHEMRGQS